MVFVVSSLAVSTFLEDENTQYTLNAVSSFFLWLKLLYFFRIFRETGHLIKMIVEVVYDMRFFFYILLFTVFAFSGSFTLLSLNNSDETERYVTDLINANLKIYELVLGNFDTSNFGSANKILMWMLFITASIFLIIVMLNLLIAIISDTFERVTGS